MKEVLTKRFWQDVKKTFDDARQDSPPNGGNLQAPAASEPSDSAVPPPPEPADKQD